MASDRESKIPPIGDLIRGVPAPAGTWPDHETGSRRVAEQVGTILAQLRFYSGKHHRHWMNLQVISSPSGDILWLSGPLAGATHDLTAARIWGIIRELAARLVVLGDNAYIGAGDHAHTPYQGETSRLAEGRQPRPAQLRSPGERANAHLKTWHIVRKLRCPWKAGRLAKAIHVLQAREIAG